MQFLTLIAIATGTVSLVIGGKCKARPYSLLKNFANLVTFGDSYTDECRLKYFASHQDNPPPVGALLPESNSTAGGGITWDRWVSIYSGAKLYNYAVSGAACSNQITYRYQALLNGTFPDVLGYEVPAFIADTNYVNASTGTNTLFTDRKADNTVYSMWIGTNDLGFEGFITDQQVPGTNIATFTECVFQAFDEIYSTGGRYFVLMNTAPLQLSPLYGTPAAGGVKTSHYWPNKPSNITEISYKMAEYTTNVNTIWEYKIPFSILIAKRYPGAEMVLFNVHQLLTDIYNNPNAYLTAPANVTGFVRQCDINKNVCQYSGDIDSYMWYDELHPSQGTDKVIAREFNNVISGNSQYATYWIASDP